MATLHFDLVAPERVLYSGEAEAVMLPGSEGDMTVLPGHAPVMTTLKAGFVLITTQQHAGSRILVRGGFAEINNTSVTILADRAMPMEEVTPETIDQEILELQTQRDGTDDWKAREAANTMIGQLEQAKEALKL